MLTVSHEDDDAIRALKAKAAGCILKGVGVGATSWGSWPTGPRGAAPWLHRPP